MPHVTIRIFEKIYTQKQKQVAAAAVTKALSEAFNEGSEHIEIDFIELREENVFVKGISLPQVAAAKAAASAPKAPAAKPKAKK